MKTEKSGQRLQALREEAGLTQRELSRRSGVHNVNISKMESGKIPVSGKSLLRIARVLKANPYYLSGEDTENFFPIS